MKQLACATVENIFKNSSKVNDFVTIDDIREWLSISNIGQGKNHEKFMKSKVAVS